MSDQKTPSDALLPLITAIDRTLPRAHALSRSALWMTRSGTLFLAALLITVLVEGMIEIIVGHPIDTGTPCLFILPLIIPLLATSGWWMTELDRSRRFFDCVRLLLAEEKREGRSRIPLSASGALLEVVMADAWARPGECDVVTATAMLTPLLQSIRTEDQASFTRAQRDRLHEIVEPRGKEYWMTGSSGVGGNNTTPLRELCQGLQPAVISALGVCGDASSIPVLERFTKKTEDPTLCAGALHSLEQIRERVRYGPEQMLRASDVPQTSDTLLHAVEADRTPQSEPQQLLRAGSAVSEEERGR